ncbi:TraV family lipoprotein [Photobacterium sp. ZSDE20]|uniref:TraV family lipoprotein n=1 Tax=Photobacterium pectinilyticum TaxID=2906793 RepID=A0ABT1N0Y6_9GAMM|nr:TraV family lipoprotein [Photobacterium sp. ZSDE20]MCQ1058395.1 TraV family lipoprotein [Photobacterium sp. ZSDE20]MDD1825242.1 TraV family lipoprotein [Photobacterium sp. ZSDE20]
MINRTTRQAFTAASLLFLAGCSSIGVGETPIDCGDDDLNGIGCVSTREVWGATDTYDHLEGMTKAEVQEEAHRNNPDVNLNPAQKRKQEEQGKGSRNTKNSADLPDSSYEHYPTPYERAAAYGRYINELNNLPSADPLAVRNTPDILRVTIAPYVDNADRLRMPAQSFIEIERRSWAIGRSASENTNRITPVNIRAKSRSANIVNGNTEVDENGFEIRTRRPQQEFNFEGILPPMPQQ